MGAGMSMVGGAVGGLASLIKGPMIASMLASVPATIAMMAPFLPIVAILAGIGLAILALKFAWENNLGDIQGKTKAAIDFIRPLLNWFGEMFDRVKTWLGDLVSAFQQALNGDMSGIVDKLKEIFIGIPTFMSNIGSSIVEGIWQGIQNMAGWLFARASEFARNIFNNIMNAIRGGSPSLLFAEVGESISMGIDKGFSDNIPHLEIPNVKVPRTAFGGVSNAAGAGGIYFAPGSIVVHGSLIGVEDFRRTIVSSVRESIQSGGFRGVIPTVSR
jgi:hypothetical protein